MSISDYNYTNLINQYRKSKCFVKYLQKPQKPIAIQRISLYNIEVIFNKKERRRQLGQGWPDCLLFFAQLLFHLFKEEQLWQ